MRKTIFFIAIIIGISLFFLTGCGFLTAVEQEKASRALQGNVSATWTNVSGDIIWKVHGQITLQDQLLQGIQSWRGTSDEFEMSVEGGTETFSRVGTGITGATVNIRVNDDGSYDFSFSHGSIKHTVTEVIGKQTLEWEETGSGSTVSFKNLPKSTKANQFSGSMTTEHGKEVIWSFMGSSSR
ncbi:MAG: hypothetical protein R6W96_00135 [Clostridia bacterium]